jgi:hypothetical protein
VAKKTAVPKTGGTAAQAGSRQQREAEVDRLLKKPSHYGTPIGAVVEMFKDVAARLGWRLDRPAMKASFTNRNGTGDVELVPEGYKTTIAKTGAAPQSRIWKNAADAFSHVGTQLRRDELP